MVEVQIINKVLHDRSVAFLLNNNITPDYFSQYAAEIKFVLNHVKNYGITPDITTFLAKFPDFPVCEINESEKYLTETLREQYIYTRMVPIVKKTAELTKTNANNAVDYLRKALSEIDGLAAGFRPGYDIVRNSPERVAEYNFRRTVSGLLGITTGFAELDKITHGWVKEDLITVVGRTNEGKTWILLYFLVAAWKAGNPVLLYSGEMSEELIGFRFDTLNEHFSNMALMRGVDDLGGKSFEDYSEYALNLSQSDVPFIVVTPKHLGGRRLSASRLHQLIEMHRPKIVGIDQISLMEDERGGQSKAERHGHIAEDLYLTSEKYQIPVISAVQANREAERDKKTKQNSPELEHIYGSDVIAQNSTRVLSIRQVEQVLKLSIKKNRYGLNNQELMFVWDIDKGVFKPFLQVNVGDDGDSVQVDCIDQTATDLF